MSMDNDRKNIHDNTRKEPLVFPLAKVAENPNPRANENIRVRIDEPQKDDHTSKEIGSEITDGEDT